MWSCYNTFRNAGLICSPAIRFTIFTLGLISKAFISIKTALDGGLREK